ncbi:MAG: hypothetical protein HYU25_14105 [Candidatus Rokubacteria bacterium]|nr:hypothetical protein [Candidatus Rokubacteria bacterium]
MEIPLVVLVVMLLPFATVVTLLRLAGRLERTRAAVIARQIALTDAIHRDLGPVVSPWVTRRGGRWRVSVAVPFDRPALVEAVLAVVQRAFPERFELVLTPRERSAS